MEQLQNQDQRDISATVETLRDFRIQRSISRRREKIEREKASADAALPFDSLRQEGIDPESPGGALVILGVIQRRLSRASRPRALSSAERGRMSEELGYPDW